MLLCGTAGWVAAIVATPASSQTQTPAAAPVQLPPATVETSPPPPFKAETVQSPKFTEPLLDTPRTINVIPKAVIEQRGATSINEVLRQVPGISLGAAEGGLAAGDRTFIRGYEARGDTFVDGFRDFGQYFRDPFNIEQVEVLKGPGSTISGRGSTGGIINYVTKQPLKENFNNGAITFGTDETKRVTADINRDIGYGVSVRLNAVGHDAEVADRDEIYQRRYGFNPSVSWGLGTPTRVTAQYFYMHQDNLPDYGHPFSAVSRKPFDVDHSNFYGLTARDFDKVNVHIGSVRFEHDFNEWLKLRTQFRGGQTERDFIVSRPLTQIPRGATTSPRDSRGRDSIDYNYGNQTDLTVDFSTWGVGHTVVTGFELIDETSQNLGRTIPMAVAADLFRPNPDTPYTGRIFYNGASTQVNVRTAAAFIVDTIKLTPEWELVGGLRYDHVKSESDARAATTLAVTNLTSYDNFVSGQGSVVYKPLPNGSVYFSYANSFNPSAELFALAANQVNLDPEENNSYEVGTKWDVFDKKLALTLAIFRIDKTNARQTVGDEVQLVGATRSQGIEFGFSGAIMPDWNIYGGYTFLDTEIRESVTPAEVGKHLPNVPTHAFSLFTTYDFLRDWQVGFGATYNSSRYANNTNTLKLPVFWRFDAMAAYRITENVALRLNLLNLTDEFYYDSTQGGNYAFVAPGRSALLTTSLNF